MLAKDDSVPLSRDWNSAVELRSTRKVLAPPVGVSGSSAAATKLPSTIRSETTRTFSGGRILRVK